GGVGKEAERLEPEQGNRRNKDDWDEPHVTQNTDQESGHAASEPKRLRARSAKACAAAATTLGSGAATDSASPSPGRDAATIRDSRLINTSPALTCWFNSAQQRSALRSRSPRVASHSYAVVFRP